MARKLAVRDSQQVSRSSLAREHSLACIRAYRRIRVDRELSPLLN